MHRTIRWLEGITKRARKLGTVIAVTGLFAISAVVPAAAQEKPNFLMIWGDDIGYWNLSGRVMDKPREEPES